MQFDQLKRREFIALLGGGVSLLLCVSAAAERATISGIKASTRNSKETMAKARAAI
jgi:hypothetical protein